MLTKKPKIGDKVICGDPNCCWSGHKEGLQGIVIAVDTLLKDWGVKVRVGRREWWHCRKCLSFGLKVYKEAGFIYPSWELFS